jgi:mRNA interferase RelE/StbE
MQKGNWLMSYKIMLSSQAKREIDRLRGDLHRRLVSNIEHLMEDPRPRGCLKIQGTENEWRIRVGEYSIIYTVDDSEKKVLIHKIGHRRDVYE